MERFAIAAAMRKTFSKCGVSSCFEKVFRIAAAIANLSMVERSEEHTSELQSLRHLVCRLLLEKKKTRNFVDFDLSKEIQELMARPYWERPVQQAQLTGCGPSIASNRRHKATAHPSEDRQQDT